MLLIQFCPVLILNTEYHPPWSLCYTVVNHTRHSRGYLHKFYLAINIFPAHSPALWWISLKYQLLDQVPDEQCNVENRLSGDCSQPLEWGGFISRYLLSPCHEILSQPLITGFCFLSPPWPFVHWQWRPRTWMTHGDQLPCVSPPIYPGHISDSHSLHDLFWSTRFCISWTHWIHAVHCGLRLNVSWAFYGHRAKVSRLHIVNDNLKGIRNRA